MYTYEYFDQRRKPCVYIDKIHSKNLKKIILHLNAYVENEITSYSKNNLGKNLFNIFSNVFLIKEIDDQIDCDVINKNELTLQKINELRNDASPKNFKKYILIKKDIDMKKYSKISKEHLGLFSKDEKGVIGFSHSGLMVLVKLFTGNEPKLQLIENYLSKHNSL